jgi:alpha-L-rhamnosidase
VVVENCKVIGPVTIAQLKLRADTPQRYEDIHYRDITVDSREGSIAAIKPWAQYTDLQGQPAPKSVVSNITLSGIKGRFGSFGSIESNHGRTEISDITLENIDVQLKQEKLKKAEAKNLKVENVVVNGKPFSL